MQSTFRVQIVGWAEEAWYCMHEGNNSLHTTQLRLVLVMFQVAGSSLCVWYVVVSTMMHRRKKGQCCCYWHSQCRSMLGASRSHVLGLTHTVI